MVNTLKATYYLVIFTIFGGIIYFLFFRAGPSHIDGLISQDARYEIAFDSATAGHLRERRDGQILNDEAVDISFTQPDSYSINSKTRGPLNFSADTRGQLIFICTDCAFQNPPMDVIWTAKEKKK